jgi:hypothetical protein
MYFILPYTKKKAKSLNLIIKPSIKKNKKIDVYDKKGNYITSIGQLGYLDYAYYLLWYGKIEADKRKKLYKSRHEKDRLIIGSNGYYADKILWS